MKTLKILGIILFGGLCWNYLYNEDEPVEQPTELTQQQPVPETVYVERKAPEPEPQPEVEVVYYDPDYPDILYKAEDVHQVKWLFPTGTSRKAFPPGSELEREWIKAHNKRYKPDYEITPVETGQ